MMLYTSTAVFAALLALSLCQDKLPDGVDILPIQKGCCPSRNYMYIDLTNGLTRGSVSGVSTPTIVKPTTDEKCATQADFRVTFQKLPKCSYQSITDQCMNIPWCGQRRLRIDLRLSDIRGNYTFNIGDSVCNNAWGGDCGNTKHDAELHSYNSNGFLWKSDVCKTQLQVLANLLAPGVNYLTIYIGNHHVRINNYKGVDVNICDKCLFQLNGQDDQNIYVALNNVISGNWRTGYGVCSATVRWDCPCY